MLTDNVTCPVYIYVGRKGVVWNYIHGGGGGGGGVEVLTIIAYLLHTNSQAMIVNT